MMKKKYFFIFIIGVLISFSFVLVNYYIFSSEITSNDKVLSNISQEELFSLIEQGKNEFYNGNLDKAISIYEKILLYPVDLKEPLKNLYYITKEIGDYTKSNYYLTQLVNLEEDNYYWKYKLGINLYLAGQWEEAQKTLEEVYYNYDKNIQQNNGGLLKKELSLLSYYLGQSYFLNDDFQLAENTFIIGINELPHLVLNYIGLAKLYKTNKEYEKAIDSYLTALKKDSSLSNLFPELAELYEIIGNDKQALYYWNRSLATGNNTIQARKRIEEISREHPEYIEKEQEKKDLERKEIKWINVKNYSLEENRITKIRVGIVDNVNKVSFKTGSNFKILENGNVVLEGKKDEAYSIEFNNSIYKFFHNKKLLKSFDSEEPLEIVLENKDYPILLYDITYGEGYFWAGTEDRQYRGIMELYPLNNSGFNIINIVNLEEYLFSVVPAEMPAWWPDEAIKAQAIAARSYAMSNLGKHNSSGYDLCDTVHCAAYNGVNSETDRSNKLILETIGEVAVYNNKVISTVFSSNSGGYSEKSKEIWGNEHPYLQGANNMLDSSYSFPQEPYEIEKWLIEEPASYSNNVTFAGYNTYRWIKVLSSDYFIEKYNIKFLEDIIPIGRSKGGTVNKILIKGDSRDIVITGDSIRSALGGLKSNRFFMEKVYSPDERIKELIIYGSGWGHHVGMDQTAAAGMAADKHNYKEIIKHFYQGTNIEKIY